MAFYRCMVQTGGSSGFEPSTQGVPFDTEYIKLPFTIEANYHVKVDFEIDTYRSNMCIVGHAVYASGRFQLIQYSNGYRTTNGDSSSPNIDISGGTTGRHTFEFNDADGQILFDDEVVEYNGSPVIVSIPTETRYYTIGYRNNNDFAGKIHRFTIIDKTDDSLVCDLKSYVNSDGAMCLYDVVNHRIYAPQKRI